MLYPGFCSASYTSQSPFADAELCMNWYPEVMESPYAKSQVALYPCPGFEDFGSVAQSPVRGLFSTGDLTERVFAVIGFKLYEFFDDGTSQDRGDVASDNYPATFATSGTSGDQMMITSGGVLYCYTLSSDNLEEITTFSGASPVVPCRQVIYLSNRFVVLDATASAYYWSAILDGSQSTGWSLGSKALRSTAADPWISMAVVLGQLWLLGTRTSDVYYTTDSPTSPYLPIQGAYLEQGVRGSFAAANLDSTLAWLGQNANGHLVVYRSNGYTPVRISTHAVEFAIQGYTHSDDAQAFAYQDQGHYFFVLSFPTDDATWVYDTITGLWHQRGYWDTGTSQFTVYRPNSYCQAFGLQLVGDRKTGSLYTMSVLNSSDVDGADIRRVRQAPHAWDGANLNRVFYPGLQIDMQTGIGLVDGTAPSLTLSWSDDGGQSFPAELDQPASTGALGQYGVRVQFFRLGSSRDRVWRIVCSDPVPWRIVQAVFRPDPIVGVN